MELDKAIISRKSIRRYTNKNVPNVLIEDLINMARLAPSAKNRQPWNFMVVKGLIKNKISNIMLNKLKHTKVDLERSLYNENSSVKETAKIIKEAPILILVFRKKDDNWIIGDSLSIGGAIEHICLKAVDLGLGSLWIRDIVYTKEEIAKLVGKSDMDLVSAISIGYPNERSKQRKRKKLDEILEWYEYGK